jgi:hypothetical protein
MKGDIAMRFLVAALLSIMVAGEALASTCYVREYSELGSGVPGVAGEPATTSYRVTFTTTAGTSAAFQSTTRFIRVWCDAQASYDIGSAPTAVNTMSPVGAGSPEYFGVKPGHKISVVANP